jgi:uncharacterized protein (DUF3820 family)
LDSEQLIALAHAKMPFGKYQDRYLIELPEYYLIWYKNKGFPKGKLGLQMAAVYELRLQGVEEILRNIRQKFPKI